MAERIRRVGPGKEGAKSSYSVYRTDDDAVGLYRVSTAEQASSGLGLEAQQAAVRAFGRRIGWRWSWALLPEPRRLACGFTARSSSVFSQHSFWNRSTVATWLP
ncbi:MAG TPA: hypothetical protein VGN83_01340 [Falsiroseomonas sp.]|nr:hypothetical protein [Falsiroseomonas sp.]